MFTGIVETTGKVILLRKKDSNLCIGIESTLAEKLKVGQSVAHNGICLTVESTTPNFPPEGGARGGRYFVTAVKETLLKTNLGWLKKGDNVNLERALKIGDRLDGHFVQGHVDTTAICDGIKKEKGSLLFKFKIQSPKPALSKASGPKAQSLIIDKGSVCINGVSLTVVQVSIPNTQYSILSFSVAIIPHTFKHTNFNSLKKGDAVNIEFDVLGKYIQKIIKK